MWQLEEMVISKYSEFVEDGFLQHAEAGRKGHLALMHQWNVIR